MTEDPHRRRHGCQSRRAIAGDVVGIPMRTTCMRAFRYVTRRVSSGARHTTVELEHSAKDLPAEGGVQEPINERVVREVPLQMVGNGVSSSHAAYSRYSLAADVIQRYSPGGVSPQQRLSSYSLHSIVAKFSYDAPMFHRSGFLAKNYGTSERRK
uniref:Uncharacterized protein n=2 Tax=Caenorhabditis japonica TaxID=281687 RepID=A0A8R1DSH7_CAEJA